MDEPTSRSRRARTGTALAIELTMRVVVLIVGLYIALDITSRPHADSFSGYLAVVFVAFGLGLTLDGVSKVLRR